MNGNHDSDRELFAEFLDETADTLAPLEQLLIELEKDPANNDIVNKIFRPIHSLKGNAAFFELMKTKDLSHKMENLLDLIRKGRKKASSDLVALLLAGLDLLRAMPIRVGFGEKEILDEDEYVELLDMLEKASAEKPLDLNELVDGLFPKLDAIFTHLPKDKQNLVEDVVTYLESFRQNPEEDSSSAKLIAPLKNLLELLREPIKTTLPEQKSQQVADQLQTMLDLADDQNTRKTVEQALDEYQTFTKQIGFDPLLRELLLEKIDKLKKRGAWKKIEPQEDETQTQTQTQTTPDQTETQAAGKTQTTTQSDTLASRAAAVEKTMRISEKRLDAFLAHVGELLVVEQMFNYLQKSLGNTAVDPSITKNFKQALETFDALSDNLRKSILAIRMVPVKNTLQKLPRVIHSIAKETGKKVDVTIEGETIDVDKSYIELLDAPLTHMARNAIDHGVESPEERKKNGKDEQGKVHIACRETDSDIELSIQDDGKGVNYAKVRDKAVAIGLIEPEEELGQDKLVELLFQAGVSTAEKVTDISGRGVGMDVVKKNIESAGGTIAIDSEPGKGSTFTISLPKNVSTQIMDGFLIQTRGQTFVLSLGQVRESFTVDPGEIQAVGDGEMVARNGRHFPVLQLDELMNIKQSKRPEQTQTPYRQKQENGKIVVIDAAGQAYALRVERILGIQKVVAKSFRRLTLDGDFFDGAAIMGDGKVVLILNCDALVQNQLEKLKSA